MLGSQAAEREGDVVRECTASLALCMLLLLKQHLTSAYSLSPERIASFNPGQLLQPSLAIQRRPFVIRQLAEISQLGHPLLL